MKAATKDAIRTAKTSGARRKLQGFWHAMADGLDYVDEVLVTRVWER